MISRLTRTLGAFVLIVAVVVGAAVGLAQIPGVAGDKVGDVLAALNPFHDDGEDRTGPAVLRSLTSLRQFQAANGYYEVVVDLEEPNSLPDFLSGEEILYVGKGEVEAVVDFGQLDERRVTRSTDGESVTVNLPAPTLGKPRLDLRTSRVVNLEEGLLTKFQGSDIERKAQLEAERRLAAAAAAEGRLVDLAEESTTAMLRGLFASLGYTDISVTFDESPVDGT